LAAVQEFDCLYVLDKGKLIEEGNHETLLAKEGKYFEMIRKQLVVLA
jgi:ATP-binding cassette, subfamily C, bacteriocin exporter